MKNDEQAKEIANLILKVIKDALEKAKKENQ